MSRMGRCWISVLCVALGACGSHGSPTNPLAGSGGALGGTFNAAAGGPNLNLTPPDEGSTQYLKLCKRYGLGAAKSIALSPDGSKVLVGGDGLAILYSRSTAQPLRRFPVEGPVGSVAFAPDGSTIALATVTKAYLFEANAGTLSATVDKPPTPATLPLAVAFSPDGTRFAIADKPRVWLYSFPGLQLLRELDVDLTFSSDRVAFAPDTSELIVRTTRGVDSIDTNTGVATQLFAMPAPAEGALAVSAGGLIAASDEAGNISLWQRGQSTPLLQKASTGSSNTLAISNDGSRLATLGGYGNSELFVWEVATGAEELHQQLGGSLSTSTNYSPYARFSTDGTQVIGNDSYQAHTFDLGTALEANTYSWGNVGDDPAVAASPDQRLLATATLGGIVVWDRSDEQIVSTSPPRLFNETVAFSADSRRLYSTTGGTVFEWDPASGALLRQSAELNQSGIDPLVASPDGRSLLARVDGGQEIILLSTETLLPILRIPAADFHTWSVVFSPDSSSFVAAPSREEIGVWDVRTGVLTARANIQADLGSVLFAAGGTRLVVAAGTDGLVFSWPELTLVHRLQRHTATISLTLAGDDRHVLSIGGDNGRVVLWDILTGQAVNEGAMDADYIPRIGLPPGMSVAFLTRRGNAVGIYCNEGGQAGVPLSSLNPR